MALEFPIVSSLVQRQIPMRHSRIYLAWLPSVIYWLLLSHILQHYHISERFQRATKSGIFSRAAREFDVARNSRHRKSQSKNIARSMTSLQYLLNFAPTLDNLKSFQWTRNSGIL